VRNWLRVFAGTGLSPRRQWIVVFVGFFLVFGSWSFAAPYDGPPDEVQHVIRAVGVVRGELFPAPAEVKDFKGRPGMGAYQEVPTGLLQHATCFGFTPHTSAACAKPISGGPVGQVQTTAGRYNPLYYALVGLPVSLSPSWGGLVGTRLISAALSAILLAFAFVVLSRWSRYGLMLAALIAVSTPMLAHLAGAVNPNGLEISAGIAMFSALIPLVFGPPRGRVGPLVWLAGVSGVILATLRSLGPMWVFFVLAALFLPPSRPLLRRLWGYRVVRWWTLGIGVAVALSMAWILGMKTGNLVNQPTPLYGYSKLSAAFQYLNQWGSIYPQGLIGVAGWFDVFMPNPVYWLWIGLTASMIVLAMVISGWADRFRFLLLIFGALVPIGVVQVAEVNQLGWIIGGRYVLPLLAGMPLLAAFILERRLLLARHARTFVRLFCVVMLPAHLLLLVYAMRRWQNGVDQAHPNPFTGSWHPPTGSVAPIVLMLVGLLVVGWTFWTAPTRIAALPDLDEGVAEAADAGTDGAAASESSLVSSAKIDLDQLSRPVTGSNGNGNGNGVHGTGEPGAPERPRPPVLDPH
jgi:Predicted membrane protein (DUF2142)